VGALLLALASLSCGTRGTTAAKIPTPDLSGTMAVIGRFGSGHACPIGPGLVLTAGHIADPYPLYSSVPFQHYRFSDSRGNEGHLSPAGVMSDGDVAVMVPSLQLARWYDRAPAAPRPGDRLWLVEFDWGGEEEAYAEKPVPVRVVRVTAGNVVFRPTAASGSSGSCVLDAAGRLVAIQAWGREVKGSEVGVAVGVWGEWIPSVEKSAN
jgi:hypothetical protein